MTSAAASDRAGAIDTATRVAKLFERHGRMIYGVCRAMLRDTHDAEDATQQTFLSAHRALLGGARVRDEGAWLATIARNECRTRIAAGMRRPLSLGDDDLALLADPGDETRRRAQAEALRSALADLPDRQREAVVLRDIYGLRYGEVAKALGLSRAATEALLFRARRAMRERLRPVVTTALVVPLSVQEGLAQAVPGFAASGSSAAVAGAAGGGFLAKLTAGPVAAKLATAAVAVTTVGAVGTVESERAGRDRAERPSLTMTVSSEADGDEASSGDLDVSPGEAGGDDGGGGPGSQGDDESGEDKSGSGSRGAESDDPGDDSSSGRSGGSEGDAASTDRDADADDTSGDDSSGRGSGSDDDGTSDADEPESSVSSDASDDEERSPSSGQGSSGEPADDDEPDSSEDDSSGKGSGDDDPDDDSSGKGSGGSGDDDPEDD